MDVNSGTLDEINAVAPEHHIFVSSRIEWLKLNDQLPKYENERES